MIKLSTIQVKLETHREIINLQLNLPSSETLTDPNDFTEPHRQVWNIKKANKQHNDVVKVFKLSNETKTCWRMKKQPCFSFSQCYLPVLTGWARFFCRCSSSLISAHFLLPLRTYQGQNEMYIFLNPPVTILHSNLKMGSEIALINDVYLAVWERKHLHGNVQRKTKQANKLRVTRSVRGLNDSFCDASLPTWESFLWDQSRTSPMASSVQAGGWVCVNVRTLKGFNPTPEMSEIWDVTLWTAHLGISLPKRWRITVRFRYDVT